MPLRGDLGNTQDLVAIEEIRDGTLVLKDGSLRQVIMVAGINFALKSEAEQNIITQAYQNFLNSLDFSAQIVIHSRKVNIERYLEGLSQYQARETSPVLQNQAEEYREFIRSFVQKNAVMEKIFLIVIAYTPLSIPGKETVSRALPFLSKKDKAAEEKAREEAMRHFDEGVSQLRQRVNQVLEGVMGIGLEAAVLNNEQLIELFYNFYNPETVEKRGIPLPPK